MKWAQEVKDEELSISISDISEKSNENEGSGNDSSSDSSFLSYNSETIALENNHHQPACSPAQTRHKQGPFQHLIQPITGKFEQ